MKRKIVPGFLDVGKIAPNAKPRYMRLAFGMLKGMFGFANLPLIRRIHPWMQVSKTNMYWIPVNQPLAEDGSIPLPYEVVEYFIEKSSTHVVMNFCGCRQAYECSRFPADIGCLMMGEDADRIPPAFSRKITRKEAREHLQKAIDAGLPPFIGKARIDNFIFGVPDNSRLLTVCFCCDCCCIANLLKYVDPEERNQIVHKLDGLEVVVDPGKCVGCGQCLEHCFIEIIRLEEGKAVIGQDCRGCGRCVAVCPENAIRVELDNPDFVKQAVAGIEAYVQV